MRIRKVEIDFAVEVEILDNEMFALNQITQAIARRNTPPGCVHWAAGTGCKPQWSKADGRAFGMEVADDAPESGEPTFDDSVFYIETCCRERYEGEK